MPTTSRGVHYPAAADPDDVPGDLQAIADWVNARPGVTPMTTSERNALSGTDLWNGRIVYNLTTQQLERYNTTGPAWEIADAAAFIPKTLVDAKGDLLVGSADDTVVRKAVGSDGQVLTADAASTGGMKWAAAVPATKTVRVSLTANLALTTATNTTVSFTTEQFDTDGFHDTVTNPSRLTVPAGLGGKYIITAAAFFGPGASGSGWSQSVQAKLNGTTVLALATTPDGQSSYGSSAHVTTVETLAAGDYIEMIASQASGANLNLSAGRNTTYLTMTRLGD